MNTAIVAVIVAALLIALVLTIRLVAKSLYRERKATQVKVASRQSKTTTP